MSNIFNLHSERTTRQAGAASYSTCSLHEGVPVTALVGALARAGLTCSNVSGQGLVIHRIGQDPRRAAPESVR